MVYGLIPNLNFCFFVIVSIRGPEGLPVTYMLNMLPVDKRIIITGNHYAPYEAQNTLFILGAFYTLIKDYVCCLVVSC